jgi:hypothetical protein
MRPPGRESLFSNERSRLTTQAPDLGRDVDAAALKPEIAPDIAKQ